MATAAQRSRVEACLLKKEGVISFYSDIAEEKVVIRTTCTFPEIQTHIWNETKMRGTAAQGGNSSNIHIRLSLTLDYSNFSQPGYLDDKTNGQQGGWLNGFSSLLQIIAVKVPAPLPIVDPCISSFSGRQGRAQSPNPTAKEWIVVFVVVDPHKTCSQPSHPHDDFCQDHTHIHQSFRQPIVEQDKDRSPNRCVVWSWVTLCEPEWKRGFQSQSSTRRVP